MEAIAAFAHSEIALPVDDAEDQRLAVVASSVPAHRAGSLVTPDNHAVIFRLTAGRCQKLRALGGRLLQPNTAFARCDHVRFEPRIGAGSAVEIVHPSVQHGNPVAAEAPGTIATVGTILSGGAGDSFAASDGP